MKNSKYVGEWPMIPVNAFLYFPSGIQIKEGERDKQWRKIFQDGSSYDQFEENAIQKLNISIKQKKLIISQWFTKANKLRFLQANKFKIEQTCNSISQASKWRKQHFPLLPAPQINSMLNDGTMYFCGRDRMYRPILIIQIGRIKQCSQKIIHRMLNNLLQYCIDNLLIQGQVQNYILFINLNQTGISDSKAVLKIVSFTSNTYRSRLFVSYLLNTPFLIASGWNKIASQFVSENTLKKIKISRSCTHEDMWLHIDKQIVEQKYGGFMRNKTHEYWPPSINIMNYVNPARTIKQITKQQYNRKYKQGRLQNRKIKQLLLQKQTEAQSEQELLNSITDKKNKKQINNSQKYIHDKNNIKQKQISLSNNNKNIKNIQQKYQNKYFQSNSRSSFNKNLLPFSKIKKQIILPIKKRQFQLFFNQHQFGNIFKRF